MIYVDYIWVENESSKRGSYGAVVYFDGTKFIDDGYKSLDDVMGAYSQENILKVMSRSDNIGINVFNDILYDIQHSDGYINIEGRDVQVDVKSQLEGFFG